MAEEEATKDGSSNQWPSHDNTGEALAIAGSGERDQESRSAGNSNIHDAVEIVDDSEDNKPEADTKSLHKEFGLALAAAGTKGSMSYSHTYPHAPNPGLQVADLGVLGLPLNPRESATLKSRYIHTQRSSELAIDRNTEGLGTWELDGSTVTFQNPQWAAWLEKSVVDACKALGVDDEASKPRWELQKLLLDDAKNAHTSPQCDSEGEFTAFATLLIILPSAFTGGTTHLSHAHLSASYDASTSSAFGTTVHAWYTGTTYHLTPPSSGARLALRFRLVHTTAAPVPSLADCTAPARTLHRLAADWTQASAGHAPEKLVLLLGGRYAKDTPAGKLHGDDVRRLRALRELARAHGLGLGLASVACCLRGQCGLADDRHRKDESEFDSEYPSDADYKPWRVDMRARWERLRRRCYETTPDGEDCTFQEVEEREVVVERFVDLDGGLIAERLEVAEGEAFPADLAKGAEKLKSDSEWCDGWKNGPLERRYCRTAVVVWPRWSPFALLADAAMEEGRPPSKRRKVAAEGRRHAGYC
ncbi:hypothetical protein PsYK624_034210 [Phanerochaete sordida]|uniref:Uncharacterized protein n=1 Tax=Phanerochaete sordida TaxID=48140 RepID=A0A9P3G311_9APHY|nr:hypothetical protein PsYK624_034210 [Phanerochaete sordida]